MRFGPLNLFRMKTNMSVPKKEWCCKKEFADFKILLDRVVQRRGKRRDKHVTELDEFFCDKVYEITMRQKGYFTEVLEREKAVKTRLQSVLNELRSLEDNNHDLRQKLAAKDVFSHNLSSSPVNAS